MRDDFEPARVTVRIYYRSNVDTARSPTIQRAHIVVRRPANICSVRQRLVRFSETTKTNPTNVERVSRRHIHVRPIIRRYATRRHVRTKRRYRRQREYTLRCSSPQARVFITRLSRGSIGNRPIIKKYKYLEIGQPMIGARIDRSRETLRTRWLRSRTNL